MPQSVADRLSKPVLRKSLPRPPEVRSAKSLPSRPRRHSTEQLPPKLPEGMGIAAALTTMMTPDMEDDDPPQSISSYTQHTPVSPSMGRSVTFSAAFSEAPCPRPQPSLHKSSSNKTLSQKSSLSSKSASSIDRRRPDWLQSVASSAPSSDDGGRKNSLADPLLCPSTPPTHDPEDDEGSDILIAPEQRRSGLYRSATTQEAPPKTTLRTLRSLSPGSTKGLARRKGSSRAAELRLVAEALDKFRSGVIPTAKPTSPSWRRAEAPPRAQTMLLTRRRTADASFARPRRRSHTSSVSRDTPASQRPTGEPTIIDRVRQIKSQRTPGKTRVFRSDVEDTSPDWLRTRFVRQTSVTDSSGRS